MAAGLLDGHQYTWHTFAAGIWAGQLPPSLPHTSLSAILPATPSSRHSSAYTALLGCLFVLPSAFAKTPSGLPQPAKPIPRRETSPTNKHTERKNENCQGRQSARRAAGGLFLWVPAALLGIPEDASSRVRASVRRPQRCRSLTSISTVGFQGSVFALPGESARS